MADITHGTWIKDGKAVDAVYQNGVKVYGRNLILNSANLSGFSTWVADGNKPTTTADGSEMTIVTKHGGLNINSANLSKNLPNVGDTVTISVEAKGTATLQFNYQNGNGYVGQQQFTVTDEYKRYFAQYTWDPINASVNQQFVIFTSDSTDATLIIKNSELEVGNVATDWTPAPEDVM